MREITLAISIWLTLISTIQGCHSVVDMTDQSSAMMRYSDAPNEENTKRVLEGHQLPATITDCTVNMTKKTIRVGKRSVEPMKIYPAKTKHNASLYDSCSENFDICEAVLICSENLEPENPELIVLQDVVKKIKEEKEKEQSNARTLTATTTKMKINKFKPKKESKDVKFKEARRNDICRRCRRIVCMLLRC